MKRTRRLPLLAIGLCGCLLFPPRVRADVVVLKDGSRLEGEIHRTDDGWLVTGADGKPKTIPLEKVASIEARPKAAVDPAEQALASLRHVVDGKGDVKDALARYKKFIDQFPGTPAAAKAKVDAQIWQDRFDRGLVKVGDKWVTADEKAALVEKSAAAAADVAQLVKQAKLKEAGPALDQIIAENPQSAAAWYLRGVVLFRQDQLPPAKQAFEKANQLAADHAPSLNNIAVILWRQNQAVTALNYYDRALVASPGRRDVLDNVAEALNALPPESREAAVTKKLVRRFNEQDAALQAAMEKQGLYRWGATFVTSNELDKLKASEKEIKAKLDKLSADFDAVSARIARIDSQVDSDTRLARRIEMDSYGRDPQTGVAVRYPYPASYYDLVHDLSALNAERAARLVDQDHMRRQAKTTAQELPTPKYTGLQRLIDADGMPLPAVAAVAGAPAPAVAPAVPVPPAPPVAAAPAAPPVTPPPATQPASSPAAPRHVVIPPEKPSIMDADPRRQPAGFPPR